MELRFQGEVLAKDGHKHIALSSPQYYCYQIDKLSEGDKVSLLVKPRKSTRSQNQNNLYWMYLGIIADDTGNSIDALHTRFKNAFLTTGFEEVFGVTERQQKSTSELSKGEFVEYLMEIEALTEVPIPDTSEWLGIKGAYKKN